MNSALNGLIRQVVAENSHAQPHDIAHLVAEATPDSDVRAYYTDALYTLVVDQIRNQRNQTLNNFNNRSPKCDERRYWSRVCAERLAVADNTWKTIGECTIEDFEYAITQRHNQISALGEQITKYEKIVAAMQEHGVDTAGELPDGAVSL